jgi:hypothetical protein
VPYSVVTRTGVYDIKCKTNSTLGLQHVYLNDILIGMLSKKSRGRSWTAITYSNIAPKGYNLIDGLSCRDDCIEYIVSTYRENREGKFLFNDERIKENFMRKQ